MKRAVIISGRAEADLAHQYRWYLDQAGSAVAGRFLEAFDTAVRQLKEHPRLGRPRNFRAPELSGIRSWPIRGSFAGHIIFYRATDQALEIERVLHGARDLPQRLVDPPEG